MRLVDGYACQSIFGRQCIKYHNCMHSLVQIRKCYERKIVIIFLPINLNMCFWVLKRTVSSRRFFWVPQHMFWVRNKENIFQLRSLIWSPAWFTGLILPRLTLDYICHTTSRLGVIWRHILNLINQYTQHWLEFRKYETELPLEIWKKYQLLSNHQIKQNNATNCVTLHWRVTSKVVYI